MERETSPKLTESTARYLRHTRIVEDPAAAPSPLSRIYESNFEDLMGRLSIDSAVAPRLFVGYTPSAAVETLAFDDGDVIVYDQYVGQSFNRLNDFALAQWPNGYVTQWGLRHLGYALAHLDALQAAAMALSLAAMWPASGRPIARSREQHRSRSLVTAAQEYFILAHECVHAAIRLEAEMVVRPDFDGLVDEVIEVAKAQKVDRERIEEKMLQDELRVLETNGIDVDDESFVSLLREGVARIPQPDPTTALNDRGHLREELFCDLVATELTIARFLSQRIPHPVILGAILLGFHHLSSFEIIRSEARTIVNPEFSAVHDGLAVRKTFWRTLVPAAFSKGIGERELRTLMADTTVMHAHTVGDQILYILPFEFGRAMDRIDGADFGRAEGEAVIRTIHEQIARHRDPLDADALLAELKARAGGSS